MIIMMAMMMMMMMIIILINWWGGSRSEDLVSDERKLEDRLGSSIEGYDERMGLA